MLKSIFVFIILSLTLTSALRYHPHYVIQHDSKPSNIFTQLRSRATKTFLPNSFTINSEPPSVLDDDEDVGPEAADTTEEQTTPDSKDSSPEESVSEEEQTENPPPSNEAEEAQNEENQEEEASTPQEEASVEKTAVTEETPEAESEESQVSEEAVISTEETIEKSEAPATEEQTDSAPPIVVVADEEEEETTETAEINEETSSEVPTAIIVPVESDTEEEVILPPEEEAEPVVPQTISRASTEEMSVLPTVIEATSESQEIDNEQVKAFSIDCTKSSDKFSKTACSLCNTHVAYNLDEDNWCIIGLAHNYKTELSKLLTNVKAAIPNTSWLAAFGENTICIVSNTDATTPDIETPLRLMAKTRLTDYIKTTIFPVTKSTILHMSAFIYDPIDEHGTTDKFILEYQIDNQIPVTLATSLHFTTSYIDSINGKVFYEGSMTLLNNDEQTSIPFILNAGEEADFYELTSVLSSNLLSTQDIVKGIGITTTSAQSQFFKNIAMTNGLNQIEAFQVASAIVTIQSSIQKSVHLTITFEKTPDFALTPEYQLTDAAGAIHINISEDGEGLTPSLRIEGVASYGEDEKKNALKALITKDQTKETIILLQDLQYPEITLSDLETPFKSKDSEFEGFLPDFENLSLGNSPLNNLTIQINRDPAPSYLLKSIIGPKGDFQLNAILTFIGGKINIKSTITAPNTGLSLLQSKNSEALLFEPFVSSTSLQITHTNHNLDTQEYTPSLGNLYKGERYWTRGTTVNYQFNLLDCTTTAFCQAITHLMPQPNQQITLSGPVDHGVLRLSSNPSNPDQVITVQNIDFKNISLHVDIAPDNTSVYLSLTNSLAINSDEKLELDGNITFDTTQGYFTSRTNGQWSNALNLDFLEINGLEITGTIGPDSFAINDASASGIMMWGKTCFLLSKNQQQNLQFVKERCFYGIGELNLNLDNIPQSYASGVYSGLTPYILLTSLLQYDDPFIFQKVSKQFLDISFINYAEVSYIPKKGSKPEEESTPTALVQVLDNSGDVPGISVKGPSKLMGLTGVTKILINLETKQLLAVFTFGTEKFANGNILLKEELSKGSNSVIFKVSDTYYTDEENSQATLSGKMSMLGLDGTISFKFTNQDTNFDAVISSEVFENIQVSGLSYDVKDLNSKFSLNGNITDDLTQFNADLGGLLKEWAVGINQIVAGKDQHLEKLQNELEIKRTESCAENSCQLVTQCETDPVYKCLQYKKKQVCKVRENYCLYSNMTCRKKESVCVHQVETCIRAEATTPAGECLSIRNECKAFAETCQDWEYSCVGDSVRTCEEFEIVDDESTCLKYGWDCNEVEIPDPQCQADCDLKNKEYVKLNQILTSLQTKYFGLKADQTKLLQFITLLNSQQLPLNINTLKFTAETDKPLTVEELNWTITYTYLGKQLTVNLIGLSLVDHREALNQVYHSISQQLAQEYEFEWQTVQEFAGYINKGLELNNETRILFLQLLDISF